MRKKTDLQKTTHSFRFEADFMDYFNTWAFISKKDKGALLQEAFEAYCKMEANKETATKVDFIFEKLK